MKLVNIPDTHGREDWKQILNKEHDFDMVVFLGDYFDTHEKITPMKQLEVFLDILEFKRANFDRAKMLIGNHDYHYMRPCNSTYSGYQSAMQYTFRDAIEKAFSLKALDTHYLYGNKLFVHAGVTNRWVSDYRLENVSQMDELFEENPYAFGFLSGAEDDPWPNPYGDNIFQSPLWVRPQSLLKDGLEGYDQIVGHTTMEKLTIEEAKGQRYFFTDVLGTSKEYLVFEGDGYEIRSL